MVQLRLHITGGYSTSFVDRSDLGQHIYREMSKSEVIKQVMGEIKHMVKRLSERDVVIVRKSME